MNGVRPYVLVVDDLPDAADTMAALLTLWGYDAEPRYSGVAALAAARLRRPAAVLLDIGMAPMDGFAFAARLRDLPGGRRTAVIAVSGHTSEAYQARGRELGITHYLFKPCDPCLVRLLLSRVVGAGAKRSGSLTGVPARVKRPFDASPRRVSCNAT